MREISVLAFDFVPAQIVLTYLFLEGVAKSDRSDESATHPLQLFQQTPHSLLKLLELWLDLIPFDIS